MSGHAFPELVFNKIILSIMKMWAKKWGELYITVKVDAEAKDKGRNRKRICQEVY